MSANSETEGRETCTACRGTGKVISSLGGTPKEVTCPWCGGDGRFHPGRNAQEERQPEN
jgi:DnaJ-class molecular chaperone